MHVIYQVNQAEYAIRASTVAPQEYVNICSTCPVTLLCIMIGSVLYPWVNGDPLNPGFRVRIPVQLTQGYKTDPIMLCKNST